MGPGTVFKPSQLVNFGWVICVIIIFIWFNQPFKDVDQIGFGWIALFALIIRFIDVYFWRYEIGEESICERRGVFSIKREFAHYYRIKSIMVNEPFWLRIFGLCNIKIITSEQFKPFILLYGIKNGKIIKEYLDRVVTFEKKSHGVTDFDIFNTNK